LWETVKPLLDSLLAESGADWLTQQEKIKQDEFDSLSEELRNNLDLLDPYNEFGLQRERIDCEINCERKFGGQCPAPLGLTQCKDDCWDDYRRDRNYYRDRNWQIEESLRGLGKQ